MKNIKVLDCTLRDGGRIINCEFPDCEVRDITYRLAKAKLDIVEVGFLRDDREIKYNGNSTFFTNVYQIEPFLDHRLENTMYVAFVDFEMFHIDSLEKCDGKSIDGIRLGFTKKSYIEKKDEIIRWANIIKERGYKLFIQGVNSLGYSDFELLEIVELVNQIHPYSFGIVDTYGAMYLEDVDRIFALIDHNLYPDISINFHSHNNYQLSFAFAQEIIKLSANNDRQVIIDGTLYGMGKVAGNLNTELLIDYLNRKLNYDYDMDMVLDLIDDYIYRYSLKYKWGYSVPALMSGVYQSHPNNVMYLTEKFRLSTKDIGKLLGMIEPATRQKYDYSNIKSIYREYIGENVDDAEIVSKLRAIFSDKDILVLVPGNSLNSYKEKIQKYVKENDLMVVSVNFVSQYKNSYVFYGNKKRYLLTENERKNSNTIVTSNIISFSEDAYIVNYHSLINREYQMFDDSTMLLLNLLLKLNIKSLRIAGADGFNKELENNFLDCTFQNERHDINSFDITNAEMGKMYQDYAERSDGMFETIFLTPTFYKPYIKNSKIVFKEGIF